MEKKQVTRTGTYGKLVQDGKMLLIKQERGPFAGKFDFPGGGIEFGESPEDALRREFQEEVALQINSCHLLENLTSVVDIIPESYLFFQIGLIYQITGFHPLENTLPEFKHHWIAPNTLTQDDCSNLLWKHLQNA